MYSRLQYISQGKTAQEQSDNIAQALDAGCNWIQLRFKNAEQNELIALAQRMKKMCVKYNSILIINDHPNIAKVIDADGVHLGLKDMSVKEARSILNNNKIIGGTANTLTDINNRIVEGCDYIGLGPFRFTTTKEKLSPVLGFEGYNTLINQINIQAKTPIYAVGGILLDDVESIINTGIYGVAVSGSLTKSADKKKLIEQFNTLLYATS